jgi:hypothetical protein
MQRGFLAGQCGQVGRSQLIDVVRDILELVEVRLFVLKELDKEISRYVVAFLCTDAGSLIV